MKRKRYSEENIMSIVKEHEAVASVPDVPTGYGMAANAIYCWKAKFRGMEVSDVKRQGGLLQENAKLKRALARADLGKSALKELVEGMVTVLKGNDILTWTESYQKVSQLGCPTVQPSHFGRKTVCSRSRDVKIGRQYSTDTLTGLPRNKNNPCRPANPRTLSAELGSKCYSSFRRSLL